MAIRLYNLAYLSVALQVKRWKQPILINLPSPYMSIYYVTGYYSYSSSFQFFISSVVQYQTTVSSFVCKFCFVLMKQSFCVCLFFFNCLFLRKYSFKYKTKKHSLGFQDNCRVNSIGTLAVCLPRKHAEIGEVAISWIWKGREV